MVRPEFEDKLIDLVSQYVKEGEDLIPDEDIVVNLACEGEHGIEFDLSLTISDIDPDA
jgi:hypothetical protein